MRISYWSSVLCSSDLMKWVVVRILVVDDSERLRSALATGLGGSGFAVDLAADGREALSYLESYDYDVIVLDLMMPFVDGIGVLREIRRRELQCRVLIVSARDQINDRVQRSEEHTSELQSLMRISYAVFCLKKK